MLALFDLDGFKRYNDTFGHPAATRCSMRLADRLATARRPRHPRTGWAATSSAGPAGDGRARAARAGARAAALSEHGDTFSIVELLDGAVAAARPRRQRCRPRSRLPTGGMYVAQDRRPAVGRRQSTDARAAACSTSGDADLHEHVAAVAAHGGASRSGSASTSATCATGQLARAELHDVGKIARARRDPHKPGALDPSEWDFMRQHHDRSASGSCATAPSLAPIAPLVRSSARALGRPGYPDGLRRSETPIGARIIAVCDAYDAMRRPSAYRRRGHADEALAELRRCAGTQFDPPSSRRSAPNSSRRCIGKGSSKTD